MDYGYNKDNPEVKSADADQPLPLSRGVSALAVRGGYRAYSEPGDIFLILAMICVLLAGALCRRRKRQEGFF